MINVDLPAKYRHVIDVSLLERTSSLVFQTITKKELIISVSFTNNTNIQRLNKKYRRVDEPTDVLSFAMNEKFPDDRLKLLGDIVISVEQATNQAKVINAPLNEEISLLLIHGILHLLGYDHDSKKKREQMWKVQDNLLLQSGISIRSPQP